MAVGLTGNSIVTTPGLDILKTLNPGTPITSPQTLNLGTGNALSAALANTVSDSSNSGDIVVTGKKLDNRVRLRPMSGSVGTPSTVLGPADPSNILYPLIATNGLLFPYTPTIQFSQDVDWKNTDLTHTNYDTAAYTKTPAVSLSVSGKFTVQTVGEGRYMLAVLHFLRVVSKMYFGKAETTKKDGKPGLPPPVLLFSGYGPYMFNDLRVVVKNHSYTLDDTVNMVNFTTPSGDPVSLPSLLTVSMTLGVVQTPSAQRDEFDLDKFRTGELMRSKGWI
jgi:hypothetical protein